jgi:hypothetical protein
VIALDIALWSGIKRKMEIAESVCQPVIIVSAKLQAFISDVEDCPSWEHVLT